MRQVKGRGSVLRLGTLLFAALAGALRADDIEYTSYFVNDNADVTVATSAFSLAKTLWRRTLVMLDVELDQTTLPPLNLDLDGISGASRPARQSKSDFRKNRGQIIGGLEQGLGDNTKLIGSYYFSHEVDYSSQAFIGGLEQQMLEKNFTVAVRAQYTVDSVGEITASGSLLNRFNETHQASVILTQLLSPTAILRVGGDAYRNHGFLSNPYSKFISINPVGPNPPDTLLEHLPGMRFRQAAWAEVSKYLSDVEGSIQVNYRYYWDDWGIESHTLTLELNKYITPDWILSPEYRYYQQTKADFGDYGPGDRPFITSDDRLKAFTAHKAGIGLTCFLRTFGNGHPNLDFLTNMSASLRYFHYFNDVDPISGSANVTEMRIKVEF